MGSDGGIELVYFRCQKQFPEPVPRRRLGFCPVETSTSEEELDFPAPRFHPVLG